MTSRYEDGSPSGDLFSTTLMFKRGGTSAAAAASAATKARAEGTHRRIWLSLQEWPQTADQISRRLKLNLNTARARISEMHKAGWVAATGEHRKTDAGKSADVWRVVEKDEPFPRSVSEFQAAAQSARKLAIPEPANAV